MTNHPRRTAAKGALAGLAAALLLLATAATLARLVGRGSDPLLAVGDVIVLLSPQPVTKFAIETFGSYDKLVLFIGVGVVVALLAAGSGALATKNWLLGLVPPVVLVLAAVAAVLTGSGTGTFKILPTVVATVIGAVTFVLLVRLARSSSGRSAAESNAPAAGDMAEDTARPVRGGTTRRTFFAAIGGVLVAAGAIAAAGRALGTGMRDAVASRANLALPAPATAAPAVPAGAELSPATPFRIANADFYRVDTALTVPQVAAEEWVLRVVGMVDTEVELSWDDITALEIVEREITLVCVSNPVGGELNGNAVWSGVRISDVLDLAGVSPDADMLLSMSIDGWTASTPLETLVGNEDAILAFSMNGEPLPFEHGFPMRMVVPGLYGYVSATKWVTELKVTRFDADKAYWSTRGYAEQAPIKHSSRIDVPESFAQLEAGANVAAGVAWAPSVGIDLVEVQIDDGDWQPAELGEVPNANTWRQWRLEWNAEPGQHTLRVRATDANGEVQTDERAEIAPDGSTGWHSVVATAT